MTPRDFSLHQGLRSVAEYAIEFRTLSAENGWNEESLQAGFSHGLSELIKDELVSYPEPTKLEDLISRAIRVDNHLHERTRERQHHFSNNSPSWQALPLSGSAS